MGLGVPYNIASYAALTHMIADMCDLPVGDFVHTLSDTHVYEDHIEALERQMLREPHKFPRLTLKKRNARAIEDYKLEDFVLEDYQCHSFLKMKMAV
jgi:thymidylate synthase